MPELHRTLPLALLIAVTSWCPAQKPAEPPKEPDPAIADKVSDMLKATRDRKMTHDAEVVHMIVELAKAWEAGLHPSDQKRVAAGLGKVFTTGKLRPATGSHIYIAASTALAKMGEFGADVLHRVADSKRFPVEPEYAPLRGMLLVDLGRTKQERYVDFLCDRVKRERDNEVLGAAGQALGEFAGSDERVRKTIVKTLTTRFSGIEGAAHQLVNNEPGQPINFEIENAKKTLRVIRNRFNAALTKLTGERFTKGTDWQRWWNKNKGRHWENVPSK